MSDTGAATTISEYFRAIDSDVTFKSCDNILFKVHQHNLVTYSQGFAPPDGLVSMSSDEVVPLQENAKVLRLLFQYMYPLTPSPSLWAIEFDTLAGLAEAAEKYEVDSAKPICHDYMKEALAKHPVKVLDYATRHRYEELMNEAAMLALEIPLKDVVSCISPVTMMAWIEYYAQWQDLVQHAFTCIKLESEWAHRDYRGKECTVWGTCVAKIMQRLVRNPGCLKNPRSTFRLPIDDCNCCDCEARLCRWRWLVEKRMGDIVDYNNFV